MVLCLNRVDKPTYFLKLEAKCRPKDNAQQAKPTDSQPRSVWEFIPWFLYQRLPNGANWPSNDGIWDESESNNSKAYVS